MGSRIIRVVGFGWFETHMFDLNRFSEIVELDDGYTIGQMMGWAMTQKSYFMDRYSRDLWLADGNFVEICEWYRDDSDMSLSNVVCIDAHHGSPLIVHEPGDRRYDDKLDFYSAKVIGDAPGGSMRQVSVLDGVHPFDMVSRGRNRYRKGHVLTSEGYRSLRSPLLVIFSEWAFAHEITYVSGQKLVDSSVPLYASFWN